MPITAKESEVKFEVVPAGNHVVRCYSMIEIGTEESEFQGKKKNLYRVRVTWFSTQLGFTASKKP